MSKEFHRAANSRTNSFRYLRSSHSDREKKISLDLVRESFGDVDMAYEEYYDWLFLKNPWGKGTVLFAYDGENPVGQVASIPCVYKIFNNYVPISLTMNVCVSPRYRGRGILNQLMDNIHKVNDSVPFSIGIPNSLSMKGHLNNNYSPMKLNFLIRPVILSNCLHNPILRSLLKPFDIIWNKNNGQRSQEHFEVFDEKFDDIEKTTTRGNHIRQVRSSTFLNWRYKSNPRRKYRVYTATGKEGVLEGYLITRISEILGISTGLIMDFVIRNKSNSGRNLIRNALNDFWNDRVTVAAAACFPNGIEYEMLKKEMFFVCPNRFRPHPLAVCVKNLSQERFRKDLVLDPDKWFFMFGDYETF